MSEVQDTESASCNLENLHIKDEPDSLSETASITDSPSKTNEQKISILLKATADAPIMKIKKWSVEKDRTIGSVSDFIKKCLKLNRSESLFLYVNQAFAPAPDEILRNLYDCYGHNGKLVLHYCKTQAWG